MPAKKSITDLPDSAFDGKRVLVRTDFNVPLNPDGSIASDHRIQETLPTLRYLLDRKAKVIIATHMGRPKGAPDPKYSLNPVVERLKQLLPETPVYYDDKPVMASETNKAVHHLKSGEILVLENIRFEPGETQNDPELAKKLASFADIYVNDAFGTAHRAHASTEGVAHYVPVKVAGLLMKRELTSLGMILEEPEKPFTAIIGGSKVSTKLDVLKRLMNSVNNLVIGGGMVFTFLRARGLSTGNSLVEEDYVDIARDLMETAEKMDRVIVLPKDVVVADRFAADAESQVVSVNQIPDGWMGLDLGPESVARITDVLQNSKTVFWNGPLGVFEFPKFAQSTREVADIIARLTSEGLMSSVIGGGDTQAAIEQFGISPESFTHVSTGGGAAMELLEGKELPGVAILDDKVPTAAGPIP